MAQCVTCGGKAGAFKSECKDCEGRRLEAQRAAEAEAARQSAERARQRAEEEARALEQRTMTYIDESVEGLRRSLEEGRTPYLYSMAFLTTQYMLLEQEGGAPPDLHDLAVLGRDGWEIVTTIPQTAGIGLSNTYQRGGGRTWGGGVGGIVTGVFVLLRLPVTSQTLDRQMDVVRAAIREQYTDGRSATSARMIVPGVDSGDIRSPGISPLAGVAMGALGMSLLADAFTGVEGGEGIDGGFDGGGDAGGGDFDFSL